MSDDVQRLKQDMAIVRLAAGLDPAWDRGAIRTHLLFTAAGLAAALFAVAPHGLWPIAGLAAFIAPVADWLWMAHTRPNASRDNAWAKQEWRAAGRVLWYVMPLAALAVWGRYVGMRPIVYAGLVWFMMGVVLFGPAVSERRMRPLLGWSVAAMCGGLLMPLSAAHLVPVLALSIGVGAAVSAALIALELRQAASA